LFLAWRNEPYLVPRESKARVSQISTQLRPPSGGPLLRPPSAGFSQNYNTPRRSSQVAGPPRGMITAEKVLKDEQRLERASGENRRIAVALGRSRSKASGWAAEPTNSSPGQLLISAQVFYRARR